MSIYLQKTPSNNFCKTANNSTIGALTLSLINKQEDGLKAIKIKVELRCFSEILCWRNFTKVFTIFFICSKRFFIIFLILKVGTLKLAGPAGGAGKQGDGDSKQRNQFSESC